MRDYLSVPSAFSTYAVGSPQPSGRVTTSTRFIGRAGTRPAIAVVVTASAMAIAFASGIEWSDISSTGPDAARLQGEQRRATSAAAGAVPGFSLASPDSRDPWRAFDQTPSRPSLAEVSLSDEERLPWLAVAQSVPTEARAAKEAAPLARKSPPAAAAKSGGRLSNTTSSRRGCEPGCSEAVFEAKSEREFASGGQVNVGAGPAPRSPDLATVRRPSAVIEKAPGLAPSGLVADTLADGGLYADAQRASLLVPEGRTHRRCAGKFGAIDRPCGRDRGACGCSHA